MYVQTVHRILRPSGWLFLKCFSDKEPGTWGPFRIAESELRGYFDGLFEIQSVVDSVFQGNVKPLPKALFATFRRREPSSGPRTQKRARKRSTRS